MAVDLKECIKIIEGGDWLSLEVIQADINKGAGGKLLIINKCRIARNRNTVLSNTVAKKTTIGSKKNPNHSLNFTRNIELRNGQILTIHPVLINKINNHIVL